MTQSRAIPTLDGLFRRTLAQRPDALALIDPPNKAQICGTAPHRLTYADADRMIGALAAHFAEARLPPGSVIALQLPNTVEFMLTVLAASRAGLVAALIPQLWRQADLAAALNQVSARAFVTCSEIDGVNHADIAMNAAVETFSIRHVCGFGPNLPDGMVSLDDVLTLTPGAIAETGRDAHSAAIITFDVVSEGLRAVPRTHLNTIAGGLVVFLESRLPQDATIIAALVPSSFGTLTASLVTWLLTGGVLALHHPFAPGVLTRQMADLFCDALIAPAPLALQLSESREFDRLPGLRHVIGLWRAPEQMATSRTWREPSASFTDVALLGEVGLLAGRRNGDGAPATLLSHAASGNGSPDQIEDVMLTAHGTLALRGAMVPRAAFGAPLPPDPAVEGHAGDYVDTGYAARHLLDRNGICITAPPAGLVSVGGYRFVTGTLQDWAARLPAGTTLTPLPDQLLGHRLAGQAVDSARTREVLLELGLNPLLAEAFRENPVRTT
jgi:hypothetical protein